ncbi:MAG: permease, partial [Candidatus Omnitrophica bacterium]|nr:permease [Candidatus Omnitrophota bacterium]
MNNACHTHPAHGRPTVKTPRVAMLSWLSPAALTLYLASYIVPFLEPFRLALNEYVRMIGWAVALGLVLGGIVDHYVPAEYISKTLSQSGKKSIVYSVGLGFLMSACSHGILTLSMELHKKGASGPAVVGFLLASPWANLPMTVLLVRFFDISGILIIMAAILVALSTGFALKFLDDKGLLEKNPNTIQTAPEYSIAQDFKSRIRTVTLSLEDVRGILKGIMALAGMVLGWILLGVLLASFASAYVPPVIFQHYFAPTAVGLLVTLFAATLLEVCSE